VALVSAGAADRRVAEEAAFALEFLDVRCTRFADVGVAGIHRLLERLDEIRGHEVVVVVAGMDAALGSVLAGLTGQPIVAVPTSVGYGASFDGIAPLLALLNACAPGVTVVGIDNGFGAAVAAHRILGLRD
jgi:NCAIR mutase (PurE)-related protein